ncbi:MAG: D-glycero-beta-D-manno-heptose-7-phosphate kinase [Candidatus Neomarinimicrobiota bacterium]
MIHKQRFLEITDKFKNKNIAVIGDLMLDTYIWGKAARISPEAPVPIVNIDSIDYNPGGAANVALNLVNMGAKASLIGRIGDDTEGRILNDLIKNKGINPDGILVDHGIPTIVKSRIIAQGQQIVRADREKKGNLSSELRTRLLSILEKTLKSCQAVILEDYNKGVLFKESILEILTLAHNFNIPVYVDPKEKNFLDFKNVRLFKPNLNEFQSAFFRGGDFEKKGQELRQNLGADLVLVTRGEDGMSLFGKDGNHHFPTKARHVHDVSGAGDTVIATFTLADISGAAIEESAFLANYAAGRVCEEVGVVPVSMEMLADSAGH